MKKLIAFIFFNYSVCLSQDVLNITLKNSCNYSNENINENLYSFKSNDDAKDVVKRILDPLGLKPNFEIEASNVQNAVAVIQDGKRYILYSLNFILNIDKSAKTDWASISILAHEIGHHLNGHTLDNEGSRPTTELEADEFSGFALFKMGASLEEAQAAMKTLNNTEGSLTHPPKTARLEAIAVGWNNARLKSETKSEVSSNSGTSTNSLNQNCQKFNLGDFCFKNITTSRIQVQISGSSDRNSRQCGSKNNGSIILEVGETKCFYDLYSCVTIYNVVKEKKGGYSASGTHFPGSSSDRYTQGQIRIEQCKSKTLEIK